MNSGYEYLKIFYEKIWYTLDYKPENIQEINFAEFVSSLYDDLVETRYQEHEMYARLVLDLSSLKLKELILDTIFSNLYFEFLLMLQNLEQSKHSLKHEFFLASVGCDKNHKINISKNCEERFRRRMHPDRLNLVKKIKIVTTDKTTFHSPVLIRAFKETLCIPRPTTGIIDISKNYLDIFYTLMFDADDTNYDDIKISREKIKAYRLWKLTDKDTSFVLNLVKNVIDNEHKGNQIAQMILLEKLFGLNIIAYLWEQQKCDDYVINVLSLMINLGYCSLHRYIADLTERENALRMMIIVADYICVICNRMLKRILKTVIKALECYNDEQRVVIIKKLIEICKDNRKMVYTGDVNNTLKDIPTERLVELIKMITGFKPAKPNPFVSSWCNADDCFENCESMKRYIKNLSNKSYHELFYNSKYKNINYKELFDISLFDLTFTKKNIFFDKPGSLEKIIQNEK